MPYVFEKACGGIHWTERSRWRLHRWSHDNKPENCSYLIIVSASLKFRIESERILALGPRLDQHQNVTKQEQRWNSLQLSDQHWRAAEGTRAAIWLYLSAPSSRFIQVPLNLSAFCIRGVFEDKERGEERHPLLCGAFTTRCVHASTAGRTNVPFRSRAMKYPTGRSFPIPGFIVCQGWTLL